MTELVLLICTSAVQPVCEEVNFGQTDPHVCEAYGALRQSYLTRELAEMGFDDPAVTFACRELDVAA